MEHFSAVKFAIGYEKNMSFLVIAKSLKVGKKVEKIGLGPCMMISGQSSLDLITLVGGVTLLVSDLILDPSQANMLPLFIF